MSCRACCVKMPGPGLSGGQLVLITGGDPLLLIWERPMNDRPPGRDVGFLSLLSFFLSRMGTVPTLGHAVVGRRARGLAAIELRGRVAGSTGTRIGSSLPTPMRPRASFPISSGPMRRLTRAAYTYVCQCHPSFYFPHVSISDGKVCYFLSRRPSNMRPEQGVLLLPRQYEESLAIVTRGACTCNTV